MATRFKVRKGTIAWKFPDRFELGVNLDITDPDEFRAFLKDFLADNLALVRRRDEFARENPGVYNMHDAELGRRLLEKYLASEKFAKDGCGEGFVEGLWKIASELAHAISGPGICTTDANDLGEAANLVRDVADGLHERGAYDR